MYVPDLIKNMNDAELMYQIKYRQKYRYGAKFIRYTSAFAVGFLIGLYFSGSRNAFTNGNI